MTAAGSVRAPPAVRRTLGALLPVLALLAVGCVDLKADAVIAADGSVRLSIGYTVPRVLSSLDLYAEGNGVLPFPLDKALLDRRSQTVPGVIITRWSREDLLDEIRVSAEIRFPNLPSLVQFLDPSGGRLTYSAEGGRKQVRVTLAGGAKPAQAALAWADARYNAYSVSLSVTLPTRAVSVVPGTLSASGTVARYASSTVNLIKLSEPLVWTILW